MGIKFSEDKPVITSKHFAIFQKMFSDAGAFAVMEAKALGLPVTGVVNDEIIKEYADGKKEVLGKAAPWVRVDKKIIRLKPKI
jgi:hypothetical protein